MTTIVMIVIAVISFCIGYLYGMAKIHSRLTQDPLLVAQYINGINKIMKPEDDKEQYYVYVEEDAGMFYAYATEFNKYEGMASSMDALIGLLSEKYPQYNIMVVDLDQ